jgi:Mor family transcriptional regulator
VSANQDDYGIELLYELTEAIQEGLGYEERVAAELAQPITEALRRRNPAERLYIPAPDKRERDEAVRREFNGRNGPDIRRKYGISKTRLYEIVKASREGQPGISPGTLQRMAKAFGNK